MRGIRGELGDSIADRIDSLGDLGGGDREALLNGLNGFESLLGGVERVSLAWEDSSGRLLLRLGHYYC